MTEKQESYIMALLKRKGIKGDNPTYNFLFDKIQRYTTTTEQASLIISELLKLEDVEENINYRKIENAAYYIVAHQKSKKNQPVYKQMKEILGFYPTRMTSYTEEQLEKLAPLFN